MPLNPRAGLFLAIAAFGSALAGSAWAQQPSDSSHSQTGQSQTSHSPTSARHYSASRPVQGQSDADRSIARLLGNMNKAEVELTQYAEDRADMDVINRFARNQNRQHSINLEELQQFDPDAGAGIGRAAADANHASDADNDRTTAFDWRQVSQEIANENLRVAKRELRDREGLDFDWAFVGQQKMLHDAMGADMTVLRRYASPALRQVIDNQLDYVKQDQNALENLMGQLKQEEQRRYASKRQTSDRGETAAVSTQRGRSDPDQPFAEEFDFVEAAFTISVRLAESPGGRPTLGLQIDNRANDRVTVAQVRPGSPAAKADLQPGDVILAVNGHDVNSPEDLIRQVTRLDVGDRVELTIDRSFASERRVPLGSGNDDDRRQSSRSNRQPAGPQGGDTRGGDGSSF